MEEFVLSFCLLTFFEPGKADPVFLYKIASYVCMNKGRDGQILLVGGKH